MNQRITFSARTRSSSCESPVCQTVTSSAHMSSTVSYSPRSMAPNSRFATSRHTSAFTGSPFLLDLKSSSGITLEHMSTPNSPVAPLAQEPRERFNEAYENRTAPWVIGEPQPAIVGLEQTGVLRGRMLDAGCGLGEHTILLTRLG